jgi:hypothetical protein
LQGLKWTDYPAATTREHLHYGSDLSDTEWAIIAPLSERTLRRHEGQI